MEWFADTWFCVALLDRHDNHHERAQRIAARISDSRRLVTHDAILIEVLSHFSEDGARAREAAAANARRYLLRSTVIPANRELFLLGLDLYASRPDKEWSHVDCMSMVVMEQRGIRHVLTNDHHFAQAGFTIVNQ